MFVPQLMKIINLSKSSQNVCIAARGEKRRVDVDVEDGWCVHSGEILGSDDRVEPQLQGKHSDWFSCEVDLHWETELGIGDVLGNYRDSWGVTTGESADKYVFAVVPAVISWGNKSLRQIVDSNIDDYLSPHTWLSTWCECEGSGNSSSTNISSSGRTSNAEVTSLDLASATAAVTIYCVSIVATRDESFSIATDFITERVIFWFKVT